MAVRMNSRYSDCIHDIEMDREMPLHAFIRTNMEFVLLQGRIHFEIAKKYYMTNLLEALTKFLENTESESK